MASEDIVGYSKLRINQQSEILRELNEIVNGTSQFREADAEGNSSACRIASPRDACATQSNATSRLRSIHNRHCCLRCFRQVVAGAGVENHDRDFASRSSVCDRVECDRRGILAGRDGDLSGRSARGVINSLLRSSSHRVADGERLRNDCGT
jgi:hypothetical protein